MFLSLIFLPFFGFFFSIIFGRFLGHKGVSLLTTSLLFISFFLSLIVFYEVGILNSKIIINFLP